jgi:hypothetical protein
MTTITGTMFGPTLREMAVAECRVAGQGLRKGDKAIHSILGKTNEEG